MRGNAVTQRFFHWATPPHYNWLDYNRMGAPHKAARCHHRPQAYLVETPFRPEKKFLQEVKPAEKMFIFEKKSSSRPLFQSHTAVCYVWHHIVGIATAQSEPDAILK